ncbi:phage replication protein O [Gracilibacillus orientalis]|uniref:Phage replication protein O n=1 Tax=Gracilibacillus orientalis TaxID=334253 RepID=A0A1I4PLX3_9BACI|nr:replication protein [Gracilibacillus orientalis]SFM28727.1 phage replication protein O [Gracilibacillus orientalis]
MASPQVEKGYIRIANDLWNEILRRDFSKRQMNLILFIWRLSYGTGQKDCIVNRFNQFEIAGVYKNDIKKELKFLRECSVLEWDEESMTFSINKDYHLWQVSPNKNWDGDKFKDLIHLNLNRKKVGETLTSDNEKVSKTLTKNRKKVSNSLTEKDQKVSKIPTTNKSSVSKTLTFISKTVSKTLTMKLVKYQPSDDGKSIVISDSSSLKTLLKTLIIKDIKECSSSNRDNYFAEVMKFYQQNLQKNVSESTFNYELIEQWYGEFGYDLLLAAMKLSAKAEVQGVKFVESVLFNWQEAGVKTLDDARLYEKQFKEIRKRRTYQPKNYGSNKKDITPDWYIKQKEEQRKKEQERKGQQSSEEERKRTAEEADRMLEEYLKQQNN